MAIEINQLELFALKKLALISSALGKSLSNSSAAKEQLALTSVLVDVIARAEIDNACPTKQTERV